MSKHLDLSEIQSRLDGVPMAKFMRIRASAWDAAQGELTCLMPPRHELSNTSECMYFHGGAIAALIDTVGTFTLIGLNRGNVVTTGVHTDLLRPAMDSVLTAVGRVRRTGRSMALVDVEILGGDDKLTATGRCNCVFLPGEA